jgi:hypothetical protein
MYQIIQNGRWDLVMIDSINQLNEDSEMIQFSVRSMNIFKRGGETHVVKKRGKKFFSFIDHDHCTIEDGRGDVVDTLFYPPVDIEELYYIHNYELLGDIDIGDLLDLSYIDPDYFSF